MNIPKWATTIICMNCVGTRSTLDCSCKTSWLVLPFQDLSHLEGSPAATSEDGQCLGPHDGTYPGLSLSQEELATLTNRSPFMNVRNL